MSCSCAISRKDRGTTFQVPYLRPSRSAAGRRRGQAASCLYRRVAAHWRRTEELRALTWSYVDLDASPPVIMVWRSVRTGGDTKTRKSRRTLELPQRCADALRNHHDRQDHFSRRAGEKWHENDLVFASRVGPSSTQGTSGARSVLVLAAAGLDSADWTPRELRHSFVSPISDAGVPIEQIARLVGHTGTTTTETVYRKQIRPVVAGWRSRHRHHDRRLGMRGSPERLDGPSGPLAGG